jgi:hypothetical protein
MSPGAEWTYSNVVGQITLQILKSFIYQYLVCLGINSWNCKGVEIFMCYSMKIYPKVCPSYFCLSCYTNRNVKNRNIIYDPNGIP